MNVSQRVARAEGVVLLVVAVFALIFQLWLPTTHVAETDYQAMAQVLATEKQPNDVVLLAPWWTERARIYVPEGLPVVGYQGSDGDSLERYSRIWVLSQPKQPDSNMGAFMNAFLSLRTAVGEERKFGNLSLQLYTNGRHRPVLIDGAEVMSSAQVYLEAPDGNRQPCQLAGTTFRCPNGKAVAKELREVHFAPYSCVRMEAPGGAPRVMMEFTSPVATDSSALQVGYIWEYGACTSPTCTPSTVWFEVNGQAQSLELATGDELMHRIEGPALPAGARVRFGLLSPNPAARVVCFVFTGNGARP